MERPKISIEAIDGKKLTADLQGIANRLGIELSKADKRKTAEILKSMPPMSDEIAKMTDPDWPPASVPHKPAKNHEV